MAELVDRLFRQCQDVRLADLSPLPSPYGRFDLDGADFAESVVTVAAPGPVFGLLNESTVDGIAVDVLQFLYALRRSAHIEVVVSRLPEVVRTLVLGAPHNRLLVGMR